MRRPFIGLPTTTDPTRGDFFLRREYAEALHKVGATPVYLPLIPDIDYIRHVIAECDALMLTGSRSDVDPRRYGTPRHPRLRTVDPRRDEMDALLLQASEERRIPVLAICYGIQSLNVYRGGTLIQDIPSQVENPVPHEAPQGSAIAHHDIEIKPDSILVELAGSCRARVNSRHHQAVDRPGHDLEPIAWAPDGVIEAVLNTAGAQLILGVQWHPELSYDEDPFSRRLFAWFVAEAKRGRQSVGQR